MNAFKCRCASSTALSSMQSTTTITFYASEVCAPCLLAALTNMPLHLTGPPHSLSLVGRFWNAVPQVNGGRSRIFH